MTETPAEKPAGSPQDSIDDERLEYMQEYLRRKINARVGPLPDGVHLETYVSGLAFPTGIAWAPGSDDIFAVEGFSSQIRVLDGDRLLEKPCAEIPEATRLLGIEVSPDFQQDRWIYVYFEDEPAGVNRVARFTVTSNHECRDQTSIVDVIPSGAVEFSRHNGGRLEFFNGYLFVSTGDTGDDALAQDVASLAGKILRLKPDGSTPRNNPLGPDGDPSPVWARGFRNPFGMFSDPMQDILYVTDNGPYCSDELNVIRREGNYGWGPDFTPTDCLGPGVGEGAIGPLVGWELTIAPTNGLVYRGPMRDLHGVLVGDFNNGFLHLLPFGSEGVENEKSFDVGASILDVIEGPGGWIYMSVRDAGNEEGDSVLRLKSRG